jgi:hypothetical protein
MSQVNDLLERIMKLRTEGVTGASVMYSWIGRRIQPLQKGDWFSFHYLRLLDQSRFTAERNNQDEAVMRVSRVLLNANIVPYLPKLFSVKNPPKQVRVSSHLLQSSTCHISKSELY